MLKKVLHQINKQKENEVSLVFKKTLEDGTIKMVAPRTMRGNILSLRILLYVSQEISRSLKSVLMTLECFIGSIEKY